MFKVAGIQIAIDYSWIAIFLLVSWSLSAGYLPHEYLGYGWRPCLGLGVVADAGVKVVATASVSDVLRQMVTADSGRLVVTDGDQVVGLITLSGLTRFIQFKTELEEEQP